VLLGNSDKKGLTVVSRTGNGAVRVGVQVDMMLMLTILLALNMQTSAALPWVFPSDLRDRIKMSDVVVSAVINDISSVGVRKVDGTMLGAEIAHAYVDRRFEGDVPADLSFTWFRPYAKEGKGFSYAGPPLSDFEVGKRYLIFLKRDTEGWVVSLPLYAIEFKLAPYPPSYASPDSSRASVSARNRAIAEELESAAVAEPPPAAGVTGMAVIYFSPVFDLLGGCADSFYEQFANTPSPELRAAAMRWMELIHSQGLECARGSVQ
jgi:hypothetical protein